jgi:hypothetical protein
MKTYKLKGTVTIDVTTIVQATSYDEAKEIALERDIQFEVGDDNEISYKNWAGYYYNDSPKDIKLILTDDQFEAGDTVFWIKNYMVNVAKI